MGQMSRQWRLLGVYVFSPSSLEFENLDLGSESCLESFRRRIPRFAQGRSEIHDGGLEFEERAKRRMIGTLLTCSQTDANAHGVLPRENRRIRRNGLCTRRRLWIVHGIRKLPDHPKSIIKETLLIKSPDAIRHPPLLLP